MTPEIRSKLLRIHKNYQRKNILDTRDAMNSTQFEQIKRKLVIFCMKMPKNLTPHEKALLLYRVVTGCVQYNHNEKDKDLRFTYASAMLTGTAVCMGISEILFVLYRLCGIDCRVVIGCITGSKDHHAWLQVRLPDENGCMTTYHMDPTWDLHKGHFGSYTYYLKSDAYMQAHKHHWLPERYDVCPKDCHYKPILDPRLVAQMCAEFERMYSPNRKYYMG